MTDSHLQDHKIEKPKKGQTYERPQPVGAERALLGYGCVGVCGDRALRAQETKCEY